MQCYVLGCYGLSYGVREPFVVLIEGTIDGAQSEQVRIWIWTVVSEIGGGLVGDTRWGEVVLDESD